MGWKDTSITVGFEKLVFEKIQLRMQGEICLDYIKACEFEHFINDYTRNIVSRLTLEMYERTADEKEIEITIERPSFLDWLLRRTKKKIVKVKLKDILKSSNANIQGHPYIEVFN